MKSMKGYFMNHTEQTGFSRSSLFRFAAALPKAAGSAGRKALRKMFLTILVLMPALSAANGADFTGVWNGYYVDPTFGRVASQLILNGAGSFQRQDRNLDTGAMMTIFGDFKVFPTQRLLRLNIRRGEPTETCGPLGCNPIRYPAGESHNYSFADANTMLLHFAACKPNQCNVTFRRAR
jgi:hypothetical protein